jgi:D-sedoheptulose 7-phosphate isomerase
MNDYLQHYLDDVSTAFKSTFEMNLVNLVEISNLMKACYLSGGTTFWVGNGGSAANAQHMSAELAGKFEMVRPPISSFALTTDTSLITSISNDFDFEQVFSRQIQAHGKKGDVLIAFSTSGESRNILEAIRIANEQEMTTVSFTGLKESSMLSISDLTIQVQSFRTPIIQDFHQILCHMLCGYLEQDLFGK